MNIASKRPLLNVYSTVDENLYYKGVNKDNVDPARLSQTHGAPEDSEGGASPLDEIFSDVDPDSKPRGRQPPYLFHSGDSLLAMTKKHNVSSLSRTYALTTEIKIAIHL